MKQIRLLLTVLLLWVGSVSAAWADGSTEYTYGGITYDLFLYDIPYGDGGFWARIKRIETNAEELTIPESFIYDGKGYQVAGFDEDFQSGNCPYLTTINITSNIYYHSSDYHIGYVSGDFSSMTKLTDIYFNLYLWEKGATTFPGNITLHAREIKNSWDSNNINYYLRPELIDDEIGYYFQMYYGDRKVASVVSLYDTDEELVIPATIAYNGGNFPVVFFDPSLPTDMYISNYAQRNIKTIEFQGDVIFYDVDLKDLSNLEKITFDGNVHFQPNVSCCLGGSNLNEVMFKGTVENLQYAFNNCQGLRKVCFYGDVPTFELHPEFYNVSGITFYVNLTTDEIRALKSNSLFWREVDVRPLNATPEGGIIVGSVSAWLSQLAPEQTLDLTTLRPIGRQDADDWATIKSLCNGTLASAQILDLREMSLAEGLQLDLSGFTSLTTVYLPANAVTMANNCFSGCNSSLQVIISSATPPTASENAFGTNGSDVQGMTLDVPSGTLNTYRTLEPWKYFGTIETTELTGSANLSMFTNASNADVEVWAGGVKIGSVTKKGGVLSKTIQLPNNVELRIPSQYLEKIMFNGIDVTDVLPSVTPSGDDYEGYTFYTLEDLTSVSFVQVTFAEGIPQLYETNSFAFLLRGKGTVTGRISSTDGNWMNVALEDGVVYQTAWGNEKREIESVVLTVKPSDGGTIIFNCGNSTYTSVDNNDGSYTYTITGENMHSNFIGIDIEEEGSGDIKTLITSRDDITLGYYYGVNVGDEGIVDYTIQQESSLQNNSATVMHSGAEASDPFGFYAETSLGIIYVQVPEGTTFRLVEDGIDQTSDCVWRYEGQEMDVLIDYDDEGEINNKWSFPCPADGYYYRQKNIQTDSYIIVDNGEGPIASPYQITVTSNCYGDGMLNLCTSEGTVLQTVSDGQQKSLTVEKGANMTLTVTAPEGVNLANYEALLIINGVASILTKTEGSDGTTTFNPFAIGNISYPQTIILAMKQINGFETPDIIEFASAKIKEICVENWDTDGDGELSKAEAAAVTSVTLNTFDYFKEHWGSSAPGPEFSFDEFQYFTQVTSIPDNFFQSAQYLVSIVLPPNITSIGKNAFGRCSRLESIVIPEGVTSIGYSAFGNCRALRSVILPPNLTEIGNIFSSCTSLSDIILPETVSSIAEGAFQSCTALKSLNLPEALTTIGRQAFYGSGLQTIFIPKNVASIGLNAFSGCSSLASIVVDKDNQTFATPDNGNVVINKDEHQTVTGICNAKIPEGVTKITTYSLCSPSVTSVEIPSSVTEIEDYGIKSCSNLTSIVSRILTPFELTTNAISGISDQCVLTVPKGKRQAYIDKGWSEDVFKGGIVEAAPDADVNGDGQVSISDAVIIVDEILNQ